MSQAGDVGKSFGSLIPASAEAAAVGDSSTTAQDGLKLPDASDPPVEANDDIQHEVAAALASVDTGRGDVATDERVAAIENLRETWSPRYRQAEEEHRRLAYRIEHADRAAKQYFSVQTELTGYIKDREERRRAEASDQAEMDVYRQWRAQAHRTMNQADRIMDDLHDMDIRITKQLLSASFASVYQDFLVLQRRIMEGHRWSHSEGRGVSGGNVGLARCAAGRRPAIATILPAQTAVEAASHAPRGTPAAW